MLSFLEPILFPLIKQICLCTTQIHNLGTSIPILTHLYTLLAIISIGDTNTATNDTPSLEGAVIALIANVDDGGGVDEGIANDAFSIALFAEAPDGNAGLFAAHD